MCSLQMVNIYNNIVDDMDLNTHIHKNQNICYLSGSLPPVLIKYPGSSFTVHLPVIEPVYRTTEDNRTGHTRLTSKIIIIFSEHHYF